MILSSDRVQLPIINAYAPPRFDSCGNELTLVVLDHGYIGFGNDFNWAHLVTIRDGVNKVMM